MPSTASGTTPSPRPYHSRKRKGYLVTGSKWSRRPARYRLAPALFRPPLPEPCMHLSAHTALRWTRRRAGRRLASRLPPCPPAVRLLPFALCVAFLRPLVGRDSDDYYGTSVALGLAPGRPSRLPSVSDVAARRSCP